MMRVVIGGCGNGKTWRLKTMVADAVRNPKWRLPFVVYDVKKEWPRGPLDPPRSPLTKGAPAIRYRAVSAKTAIKQIASGKELPPLLIARPTVAGEVEQAQEFAALVRAVLDRGRMVLVAPEIWRFAPEGKPLPRTIAELAREHRHRTVGLWADAQSIPEVSKALFRRADYWVLCGTGALSDLEALKKRGGKPLADAMREAGRLNKAKAPGHHLVWVPSSLPPYRLLDPRGKLVAEFGGGSRCPTCGAPT